ncbi:hypothetical protein SDC9_202712 [bioreactor metagenome]|uniref:Uncharacterized protein n=1 Tax=bioreactor metagenome TaxID=1076179 RepID=A0A645J6D1_9ZZZZ
MYLAASCSPSNPVTLALSLFSPLSIDSLSISFSILFTLSCLSIFDNIPFETDDADAGVVNNIGATITADAATTHIFFFLDIIQIPPCKYKHFFKLLYYIYRLFYVIYFYFYKKK